MPDVGGVEGEQLGRRAHLGGSPWREQLAVQPVGSTCTTIRRAQCGQ